MVAENFLKEPMESIRKIVGALREEVRKSPQIFYGGGIFLLLLGASILFFYMAPRESQVVRKVTDTFPYPIVWVEGSIITERALAQNMASVRRFYENQDFSSLGLRVDFSTEEGQKRLQVREREVLNKMVEDASFRAIAKKRGITITEEEVKQDIKARVDAYGTGAEVESNLQKLYGWGVKDFAEKVVTPALYQERLQAVYEQEEDQTVSREKIEAAERELAGGVSFSEVAQKYSEGSSSQGGGSLGWFQILDLAPELQETVKTAQVGKVTPVVESSLGFHIILVEETKTDGDTTLYRLSQIFVKKVAFSSWLTKEMQKLSIHVWSPFYRWNPERAQVDFREESWQQYEQSVYENSAQDALFVD